MIWLLALALWGDAPAAVREAVEEHTRGLPNYLCRQETRRFLSDRAQNRKQLLDRLDAEVAFTAGGQELRELKRNGKPVADHRALAESGAWSVGEFGTMLRNLFDEALRVEFRASGDGRSFDFVADRSASRWEVWQGKIKTTVPFQGTMWLDGPTHLPKRVLMRTRSLPAGMGVDLMETQVEYGWVKLGERRAWLPLRSDNLSCLARRQTCYYNVSEYKDYRRFEAESRVVP